MFQTLTQNLFCALCCAALLLPVSSFGQEPPPLPIVFEEYPPYEYVEDGEVKGINMDIIREAFKRMGIKPFFEPRPWKRAIYELKNGEILALSSGFRTKEREEFAVFSEGAGLGMETNCVIALSVSGLKIESLEDLRGLRIGVVRDYVYGEQFESMTGLNKIKAASADQLLRMLLSQRMDVLVGNKTVFKFLAKKMGKLAHINILYEIGSEPLYLMFSRVRGPKMINLAHEFGIVVRQMKKDGTFAAIEARY